MSITRSFITELRKPFDMAHSAATRVASECPYLKAALRRTSWLASPCGLYEFRSRVWFDDQRYHAIVMARTVLPPTVTYRLYIAPADGRRGTQM